MCCQLPVRKRPGRIGFYHMRPRICDYLRNCISLNSTEQVAGLGGIVVGGRKKISDILSFSPIEVNRELFK